MLQKQRCISQVSIVQTKPGTRGRKKGQQEKEPKLFVVGNDRGSKVNSTLKLQTIHPNFRGISLESKEVMLSYIVS